MDWVHPGEPQYLESVPDITTSVVTSNESHVDSKGFALLSQLHYG